MYLGIHKPEASSSFVFGQALPHEILHDLFSNTNSSASGSHEYRSLIFNRNSGFLQRIDDSGQDDSSGTLNIIIEA
jgi:hypothetical protein